MGFLQYEARPELDFSDVQCVTYNYNNIVEAAMKLD